MKDLVDYLPPHLAADPEVRAIMDALTVLLRRFLDAIDDVYLQFQPQTATWGLEMWETAFAVPTDPTLSLERRREIVIAKIRSARTATVEAIRNLAAAYTDGEVTVEEHNDDFWYNVVITCYEQTTAWSESLRRSLEDFSPAHLRFAIDLVMVGGAAVEYVHTAMVAQEIVDSMTALKY